MRLLGDIGRVTLGDIRTLTLVEVGTSGADFPEDESEGVHINLFQRGFAVSKVDGSLKDLWCHVTQRTNLEQNVFI